MREDIRQEKTKKRLRIKPIIPFSIALILILIFGVLYFIQKSVGNLTLLSFYDYHTELTTDDYNVVLEDEIVNLLHKPKLIDNIIYIPVDFIFEYVDKYIYWDGQENILVITTQDKVIRMKPYEKDYYINGRRLSCETPISMIRGVAYVPEDIVMLNYDVRISRDADNKLVIVDYTGREHKEGIIASKIARVRYEADKESPLAATISKGDKVCVYGETEGFTKIRLQNGVTGYVETKQLDKVNIVPAEVEQDTALVDEPLFEGDVCVVWDQVFNTTANRNEWRYVKPYGVDVLSPTWFSFDEEKLDGKIIDIGDKGYVEWAHENGIQVWGLLSDNFKESVSSSVLTSTAVRGDVIKQLLALAQKYGLDGINIDFEQVRYEDASLFIQFLRELYPVMRENNLILSVDMYVPKPFNIYYNRTEAAKASDYIIIMGYDEYWSTSPEAGPVASIGFAEDGIIETLKEVPKDKIILGVPVFTRIWKDAAGVISSSAYSMQDGLDIFVDAGAEFTWLEDKGCYYSEYEVEEDGITVKYMIWLEDERSLSEKLKLVDKYDIAGVAVWKRGLEKDFVWELISGYLD